MFYEFISSHPLFLLSWYFCTIHLIVVSHRQFSPCVLPKSTHSHHSSRDCPTPTRIQATRLSVSLSCNFHCTDIPKSELHSTEHDHIAALVHGWLRACVCVFVCVFASEKPPPPWCPITHLALTPSTLICQFQKHTHTYTRTFTRCEWLPPATVSRSCAAELGASCISKMGAICDAPPTIRICLALRALCCCECTQTVPRRMRNTTSRIEITWWAHRRSRTTMLFVHLAICHWIMAFGLPLGNLITVSIFRARIGDLDFLTQIMWISLFHFDDGESPPRIVCVEKFRNWLDKHPRE